MKNHLILLSLVSVAVALPPAKPTNCIQGCTCKNILSNILNVASCDFPLTINSTLFSHLDRRIITVIAFSNVIIDEIKDNAFKRLPNLQDVVIKNSKIGSIDNKAFDNVLKVKFADCAFEDSPILTSEKLTELHFGNCQLDVIPPLDNLFSLAFLNLSGNYIKEIEIRTFFELFELETLILSNNEISRIPPNIFQNNKELSALYLDNNPLKLFNLTAPNRLETLSLSNCYLSTFDQSYGRKFSSLSKLNLKNNRISKFNLSPMGNLEVVDLSGNNLKKLDYDIFWSNPRLLTVKLDNNKFETLPNFTLYNNGHFQIYSFSCRNCGLKVLHPDTFKNMPALISLDLSYNNLTNIGDSLKYLRTLKMLDISYNSIHTLSGAFDSVRNLETLTLAGNPLMALNPKDFVNNDAIGKIDASNCKLTKLWGNNATSLSSLRKLFVADNQLTSLSLADFAISPNLKAIDLHGNPLVFNDQFCKVINYLESESVYPVKSLMKNSKDPLEGDIDNFTANDWQGFHNNACTEISNNLDDIIDNPDDEDKLTKDDNEIGDDEYDDDNEYEENYDDDYNEKTDGMTKNEQNEISRQPTAEIIEGENINLARVSYILSITSVFVLTALAVLIMAVVITLCILRRNDNFNMHRANLPRLKIPLWDTQFTEKKHSGSIYRPLSEDLSGPKTPKMSRYDFTAAPTVHASNP